MVELGFTTLLTAWHGFQLQRVDVWCSWSLLRVRTEPLLEDVSIPLHALQDICIEVPVATNENVTLTELQALSRWFDSSSSG